MAKQVIIEMLRILIFFIWTFLGAIFWIPFLARMIAVFTISVLLAVTKGNPMSSAENGLEAGVTFYIDGFRKINEGINNISSSKKKPNQEARNHLDSSSWETLLIQFSYTIVFWLVTLFILGKITLPSF